MQPAAVGLHCTFSDCCSQNPLQPRKCWVLLPNLWQLAAKQHLTGGYCLGKTCLTTQVDLNL